jgi:aldehyde dehydrogenase (NAD(P)+)
VDDQRSSVIAHLDNDLHVLRDGARRWASLPIPQKIDVLIATRSATGRSARRWTARAAASKGVAGTFLEGEEAITGPWAMLAALNAHVETLREIGRLGAPFLDPRRIRRRRDGQLVVEVFPRGAHDRALFNGIRAEVWMQPDVTPATLHDTMAAWYRQATKPQARLALVLGAGNITSIGVLDVLYKLVAHGTACMLKLHPLLDYLQPILEDSLEPLMAAGYVRLARGGADVGAYLCAHGLVDDIHVTGGKATYDAIARRAPEKTITSELGNVSPTIVLPGRWSEADLNFQAEQIVTTKLHNAGFNCVASQVLILPAQWNQRGALLDRIDAAMRRAFERPAYYPGARERYMRLRGKRLARCYGRDDDGFIPRTLVEVDAANLHESGFQEEAFCPLLFVTSLAGDCAAYLKLAAEFANERLWGNLAANLIADPASMREHAHAFDAAIANLRYGCIGVNAWSGVGFLLPPVPWGAYRAPDHHASASGVGVVHNSRLFDRSQKAVVHAPFAPFPRSMLRSRTLLPKPPWFVTNKNQAEIGGALCEFETAPSPLRLAKVALLALRG